MSNYNTDRAKRLLRHYLGMAVTAGGYAVDSDINSEIDDIVDCLIAAAVEEMQASQPAPAVQGQMFPAGEDLPMFTAGG